MKNRLKIILFLLSFLILAGGTVKYINNKTSVNFSQKKEVEKLFNYISDTEGVNLDKEYLERGIPHLTRAIQDKNTSLSSAYFILGYIDGINLRNDSAIENLNSAIFHFDQNTLPEVQIKTYYELSRIYAREKDFEKSQKFFNELLTICKTEKMKEYLVDFSIKRSYDIYYAPNGIQQAFELLKDTLEIARKINYHALEDVYMRTGILAWHSDKVVKALNYKLEAWEIVQEKKIDKKMAHLSTDIGIDYLYSQNYLEAIRYLKKSLEYDISNPQDNAHMKVYALLNLLDAYNKMGNFTEAKNHLPLLKENIDKLEKGDRKEDYTTVMYTVMGDIEMGLKNFEKSLEYLNLGKTRFESTKKFTIYDMDIEIATKFGNLYYNLKDYVRALDFYMEAESLAAERGLKYFKDIHSLALFKTYKELGQQKNALKELEKNNNLKVNYRNNRDAEYSQFMVEKFQNSKNEKQIHDLQEEKRNIRLILLVVTLLGAIISIFTFFIFKKNREINRLNTLFKNLSNIDGLTKIANRRALDDYLAGNWALYSKTHMPISFIMIDVDYFKNYNDNYGHMAGDNILVHVADLLTKSCSSSDFIARYGGEEFIIILLNTSKEQAIGVMEKIRYNLHELNLKHNHSPISDRVTLSMGLTTAYIDSVRDYKKYLQNADSALYISKKNGRDRFTTLI